MIRHYLKTIIRAVFRHKSSSAINITGLAVGTACCLLVSLWIIGEYNYDTFHANFQSTYRVFTDGHTAMNPATPAPLAAALAEQFPGIEAASRFEPFSTSLLSNNDKRFYEENIVAADPALFEIFSFPMLRGDPATALENTYSLVLTESVARKYFGDEDPVGKALTVNQSRLFTVTGVIADVPANSSLRFDILVPFEYRIQLAKEITGWDMDWRWYSPSTYIKLGDNADVSELEKKISEFFAGRTEDEEDGLSLMRFEDHYFYVSGTRSYVYVFASIALLIIVMACINFVNLATARSSQRAREIGVRKVSGATRKNLVMLLLGESISISLFSLMIAVALVELAIPHIKSLTGASFLVDALSVPYFLPGALVFAIIIGIVAGTYPAFYLSSLKPVSTFKGGLKAGKKGLTLRRLLVIVQIACSVLLIVGTTVIFEQFDYLKNKDVGYQKHSVINVPLMGECRDLYTTLKQEMRRNQVVADVGGSAGSFPYWRWTTGLVGWDGRNPDEEVQVCMNFVDFGLVEAMNIEIVEGRSFSEEFRSDIMSGYLVNEEMVRLMGVESAVGASLSYGDSVGQIVGVVKDFHFEPLEGRIRPLVLALVPGQSGNLVMRFHPGDIASQLASVEEVWQRIAPGFPFDYYFISDELERRFNPVQRLGTISGSLAVVAVFIAGLGLFGLASFMTEQRTKEIGIRKVLGATAASVAGLLSKEHLLLTVIANLIAWPVAYWVMNSWLQNFAYHAELTIRQFLLACLLALVIVLVSVSSQAYRAATSNPVDSLRSE